MSHIQKKIAFANTRLYIKVPHQLGPGTCNSNNMCLSTCWEVTTIKSNLYNSDNSTLSKATLLF